MRVGGVRIRLGGRNAPLAEDEAELAAMMDAPRIDVDRRCYAVVRYHAWEGPDVLGVFLERDAAEAARDLLNDDYGDEVEADGDDSLCRYRVFTYPLGKVKA